MLRIPGRAKAARRRRAAGGAAPVPDPRREGRLSRPQPRGGGPGEVSFGGRAGGPGLPLSGRPVGSSVGRQAAGAHRAGQVDCRQGRAGFRGPDPSLAGPRLPGAAEVLQAVLQAVRGRIEGSQGGRASGEGGRCTHTFLCEYQGRPR
jgi:hypothetical protein